MYMTSLAMYLNIHVHTCMHTRVLEHVHTSIHTNTHMQVTCVDRQIVSGNACKAAKGGLGRRLLLDTYV